MSDDLESRAAYGAQVHAHRVEAQQRGFTPSPKAPEVNALATRSLTEAVKTRGINVDALVFLVTLLAVALASFFLRDDIKLAAIIGGAIAIFGAICTIIATLHRKAQQLRRALRWFDTIPFVFDRRHYLECLGEGRKGTRIELQIAFTATLTPQEMEMFANAASGSAAIAHRQLDANVLTLSSVPLKTAFPIPGSGRSRVTYPNNRLAHAWILSVTDGALRLIHERQPIERVAVKMESFSIVD